MFGLVHCNASLLARQNTDANLYFVRSLVKSWLWPIITFFGVTGNILAVIVLTKRRMIMSSTNNYLVALALVDIAYLALTLILNTALHPCFTGSTISDILHTICRPIADFSSNTSVWLTVSFTVERWVAITYPLQSRTWCTVSRARKIIISVMCAALICTSPSAFETKLVRVFEIQNASNSSEKPLLTSRIRAKPTVLGNSILYHQIYFNFVTFAIIWIPLLLLVIFNTVLIIYVHHSRQNERKNSQGIKLRRHNRGNQGEQRKTTIMLIAVVLVFTICQIPQAFSLTVQSFLPVLSQTPTVLIYNNFANCLVALNASMNFLLYCCFSERFRTTFRSSFAFLSKYCVQLLEPNWKLSTSQPKHSISLDTVSMTSPYDQSNYSLHGQPLNARISNMSNDVSQKCLRQTTGGASQRQSQLSYNQNRQSHTTLLSRFHSDRRNKPALKRTLVWQSTETYPNTRTTSILKGPLSPTRQSPSSNGSTPGSAILTPTLEEKRPLRVSTVSFASEKTPSKHFSSSMCALNQTTNPQRSSNEKLKTLLCSDSGHSNKQPKYHSQHLLNNHNNEEQIWIKRRLSNGAIEKLFDPQKSFLWREIVDVTV